MIESLRILRKKHQKLTDCAKSIVIKLKLLKLVIAFMGK